jgi:hypothetical protein
MRKGSARACSLTAADQSSWPIGMICTPDLIEHRNCWRRCFIGHSRRRAGSPSHFCAGLRFWLSRTMTLTSPPPDEKRNSTPMSDRQQLEPSESDSETQLADPLRSGSHSSLQTLTCTSPIMGSCAMLYGDVMAEWREGEGGRSCLCEGSCLAQASGHFGQL